LSAQRPSKHAPVQHVVPVVQASPTSEHVDAAAAHLPVLVVHAPLQQSADCVQDAPSAAHAEVQNRALSAPSTHVPPQQSAVVAHGAPRGRHGPGPRSHRPSVQP
jgi:hypothetical protein